MTDGVVHLTFFCLISKLAGRYYSIYLYNEGKRELLAYFFSHSIVIKK